MRRNLTVPQSPSFLVGLLDMIDISWLVSQTYRTCFEAGRTFVLDCSVWQPGKFLAELFFSIVHVLNICTFDLACSICHLLPCNVRHFPFLVFFCFCFLLFFFCHSRNGLEQKTPKVLY